MMRSCRTSGSYVPNLPHALRRHCSARAPADVWGAHTREPVKSNETAMCGV